MTDAWELARAKARAATVRLAPLTTVEDADRINGVIARTWGGQHLDREVIRALALSGNVSWGAFDDDELVGFVLGWAGVDEDGLHVHSHMLAALPDRRHRGVGETLKLAQRAQALDQGIQVMRWTFDPMQARNAWLNIGKLGAQIDRFERDFYGSMGDDINRDDRSDRFTVVWDLRREPGPRTVHGEEGVDIVSVLVPREYESLREADPAEAARWREVVAVAAERLLSGGMRGVAFDRERSAYVFAREDVVA